MHRSGPLPLNFEGPEQVFFFFLGGGGGGGVKTAKMRVKENHAHDKFAIKEFSLSYNAIQSIQNCG